MKGTMVRLHVWLSSVNHADSILATSMKDHISNTAGRRARKAFGLAACHEQSNWGLAADHDILVQGNMHCTISLN